MFLFVPAIPFIYYALAIFSAWSFFRKRSNRNSSSFTPPISNLKPVRGLDPDAYENFASFCRQDYPEYEIVFCIGSVDDPAYPVLQKVIADFPNTKIRVLFGSGRIASNDKVAKLARMSGEAAHEHLVISDSDVRVRPDYLRSLIAPLADPKVGAVTCFYVALGETTFAESLQSMGMISDFYPGILVARRLDGVKFALGTTIATTRTHLAEFGGYASIENQPADDLLVGRLIAEQGYQIELLNYSIDTVSDYQSMRDLLHKRLRWLVVMRHMRPWGHVGMLLTQGLPWSLFAIAIHPTLAVAASFLGTYFVLRLIMTLLVGSYGLKIPGLAKKAATIVAWDALAFCLWAASFARNTVRWRGGDYYIRDGKLVPAAE